MENKNIILILTAVIVVLAAIFGAMLFNPTNAQEPTKINITSDKEQYEGGNLSIQLTDLNNTPISKEIVNITITNSTGEMVVDDVVKTNSTGEAKLGLNLKKGEYNVTVGYGGNENYTGNNTTQKLTIKEEEKVAESSNTNSNANSNSKSQGQKQTDYNSPDSEYFRSEVDGNYYKKEEGVKYEYAQDGVTGEWSYWIDKS